VIPAQIAAIRALWKAQDLSDLADALLLRRRGIGGVSLVHRPKAWYFYRRGNGGSAAGIRPLGPQLGFLRGNQLSRAKIVT